MELCERCNLVPGHRRDEWSYAIACDDCVAYWVNIWAGEGEGDEYVQWWESVTKPRFTVTLVRTEICEIEVEAANEEEAEQLARDASIEGTHEGERIQWDRDLDVTVEMQHVD